MELDEPLEERAVLIVAAHPDDETIGAGARMARWRGRVRILHVTDGSPRNPADAQKAGCATREEYAQLREREVLNAMALAGVSADCRRRAGFGDQETSFALEDLVQSLASAIEEIRPAMVLTHPYEGGHPDHDACAFAVQASVAARPEIARWEFTSYHAGPSGTVTGRFLPDSHQPVLTYRLSSAERQSKGEMMQCFGSQLHILMNFGLEEESFRRAPRYDFTKPPHEGRLHYENFDWGVTGAQWRELAVAALKNMGPAAYAANRS